MLGELPDGNEQAEEDCGVRYRFKRAAAFFFGANEESISGFLVVLHKSFFGYVRILMQRSCHAILLSRKPLIRNSIQISPLNSASPKRSAPGNLLFRFWDGFFGRRQIWNYIVQRLTDTAATRTHNVTNSDIAMSSRDEVVEAVVPTACLFESVVDTTTATTMHMSRKQDGAFGPSRTGTSLGDGATQRGSRRR
jgi:hypothetical protein